MDKLDESFRPMFFDATGQLGEAWNEFIIVNQWESHLDTRNNRGYFNDDDASSAFSPLLVVSEVLLRNIAFFSGQITSYG